MAIFLTRDSKVIVQGMTGSEGMKHTTRMLASGTQVVGGVNPRKAWHDGRLPRRRPGAGLRHRRRRNRGHRRQRLGHLRPGRLHQGRGRRGRRRQDPAGRRHHRGRGGQGHGRVLRIRPEVRHDASHRPELPGLITPGQANAGIIPADISGPGRIGLVSKSGTLTYQMMFELRDFGFSTAVGIGGDPIIGTTHIDCLQAFQDDPDTDAIVMIGEIGGDAEERAAAYIAANVTKPVVGYVAGFTAPEGKTMGHAGAIVSGSKGTAAAKAEALEAAGVKVGKTPSATAALMREIMQGLQG
jgi:succinyl-CoA synthetase alpha subunit